MTLELRKNVDGTGFVICIVGVLRELHVPLAQELSGEIDLMLRAEGFQPTGVPPLTPG